MTTRCLVTSFALALCSLFLATVDSAQTTDAIDLIGGVCVPDSTTVRAGVYKTAGFGIRFSGNAIGNVRLLCPFPPGTGMAQLPRDIRAAIADVKSSFRRRPRPTALFS
jgi:hypothetical protein